MYYRPRKIRKWSSSKAKYGPASLFNRNSSSKSALVLTVHYNLTRYKWQMPTDESHNNVFIKKTNFFAYDIVFSRVFLTAFSNYEILLSLVSVFMCSQSITDGVIWDEIFSKVTLCVGCMVLCCLFYCYPHPEAERKEFDVFWRFGIFWKNAHQSSSFLKKICINFVIT